MAIDILFIIATVFGFYFGFIYGPIKAVIFLATILGAVASAMQFTPLTAKLIQDTFLWDSPFIPFIALGSTFIVLLLIALLLLRIFEENVDGERFNRLSQFLGGIMVSFVSTFLFSILIQFFVAATVIEPEKTRQTSFFYGYVEQLPARGQVILSAVMPFIQKFMFYMKTAIERINERNQGPKRSRNLGTDRENTENPPNNTKPPEQQNPPEPLSPPENNN